MAGLSVLGLVTVTACGNSADDPGYPVVPPPEIAAGRGIPCGEAPVTPVDLGLTTLVVSDDSCGTALRIVGGTAELADPDGSRFLVVKVVLQAKETAVPSPLIVIRCGGGDLVEASAFRSALAYRSGEEMEPGSTVEGWITFGVRSRCESPVLVAGDDQTEVMELFPESDP